MTAGVAWMDGRSRTAGARQAQAASGELRAELDGSRGGGGGGVAYEARGYKQGWADERAEDGQADGPNRAILARAYNLSSSPDSAIGEKSLTTMARRLLF